MMSTILRNVRAFTELKDLGDDSGNVDPTVEQVVGGGDTQVSFSLVRVTHLQILLDAFIVLLVRGVNLSICQYNTVYDPCRLPGPLADRNIKSRTL